MSVNEIMPAGTPVINTSYDIQRTWRRISIEKRNNIVMISGLDWIRCKDVSKLGNLNKSTFKEQYHTTCVGDDAHDTSSYMMNEIGQAELKSMLWKLDDKAYACLVFRFNEKDAKGTWREYSLCNADCSKTLRVVDDGDDPFIKGDDMVYVVWRVRRC